MIAAIAGMGPKHIHPTVTLIIPITIAAVARLLFGGCAYKGGGGGCQPGVTGFGSASCPPDSPADGRFQVACSFGLGDAGELEAMTVGGGSLGSLGRGASSSRVVPSTVQKLSHSSSNV